MVCIHTGLKVYQGVTLPPGGVGAPIPSGWKLGKVVQRAHKVVVREDAAVYVALDDDPEARPSDADTVKAACMREYDLHAPATPAEGGSCVGASASNRR